MTNDKPHSFYIELIDRSTSRMIFSSTTGDLSAEQFTRLWEAVGTRIFALGSDKEVRYFEVRISPVIF